MSDPQYPEHFALLHTVNDTKVVVDLRFVSAITLDGDRLVVHFNGEFVAVAEAQHPKLFNRWIAAREASIYVGFGR